MMASYYVVHGKEEKGFPPPHHHKLFQTHGFVVQDSGTASGCEEQTTTDGVRKVKTNWWNDSIFCSYGWSEHSSSSGLSSPFGSELGSTETESEEDEDFIAQLTRQLADYMLKDDEEEVDVSVDEKKRVPNCTTNTVQTSKPRELAENWSNYKSRGICYYSQESLGTYVKPMEDSVNHQVYHLKDQPTTAKRRLSNSRGKRIKDQKLKTEINRDQNNMQSTYTKKQTLGEHGHCGDKIHHHQIQSTGASMRTIFLRGKNRSSGTGVFFPRRINPNPTDTEPKKKSENGKKSLISNENQHSEDQEMQLPQEWTY